MRDARSRARVGAVVLAAGEGRRFGLPKALARLRGVPLVARVAANASAVAADVVVVLGARAEEALPLVPPPARAVVHAGGARGRTGSLKAGLRALGDVDAVLVWPVDVPVATAEDARALVRAFEATGRAAVPVVDSRRGHPVLLPASVLHDVLALGDDDPLHDIVRAAEPVEVPAGPGTLLDVDTQDDLRHAEALIHGLQDGDVSALRASTSSSRDRWSQEAVE